MTRTNTQQPDIILITGNMASGKSTIAQALAERLPKSVHLRGDLFRRMIVNGQAEMTFDLSAEAHKQLNLRYELAAQTAKGYADAGFTVIYQDIVIGETLQTIVDSFQRYRLAVVVLCPRPDVVAGRDLARDKTGYPDRNAVDAFDRVLHSETARIGYWLDNSDFTVAQTVDELLLHLDQATIQPGSIDN